MRKAVLFAVLLGLVFVFPVAAEAGGEMAKHKFLVLDAPYALIEDWTSFFEYTKERFGLGAFEITVPLDHAQAAALVKYKRVLIVRGDDDWSNQAARLWGVILDVRQFYAEGAAPDLGESGKGAAFVTAMGVTFTEYFLSSRVYPLVAPVDLNPKSPGVFYSGWTGSFADIDEGVDSHDGDTTYIASSTKGAIATVDLDDYPYTGVAIAGIRIRSVWRTPSAGALTPHVVVQAPNHYYVAAIPSGNGTDTAWTGAYTDIDDGIWSASDGDATYISSSVVGAKESVTVPAIGLARNAVFPKVLVYYVARKTTTASVVIKPYVLLDGTRYYGSDQALGIDYEDATMTWFMNPANGECWTLADLNDAQFGVEVVTCAGGEARVTNLYAVISYVFEYALTQVGASYQERYVDIAQNPATGADWTIAELNTVLFEVGVRLLGDNEARVTALSVRVYPRCVQGTGALDNILKDWVNANLGAGATANRQVTGFTEEADESAAASATYEIAYNLLLQRFMELAKLGDVGMDIAGNWNGGANRLDGVIEDEAGGSFGAAYHGLSLADGQAFFRCQGVDLSPFAGVEGTSTPYKLELTDTAGKVASGYIGAADAVEALGGELLSNVGFETAGGGGADIWGTWNEGAGDGALADETVLVHGGSHAAKITAGASANTFVRQQITVTPGKLYKLTFWTRGDGTNAGRYGVRDSSTSIWLISVRSTNVSGAVYTQAIAYFVPIDISVWIWGYCPSANGGIAYFDDYSLKEATHVGVDGVHIVSAKDGSTRNWKSVASGFLYNDTVYTFDVSLSSRYEFQTRSPEGVDRTHDQGVNTPVIISRGRGLVKMLDYELEAVSAKNAAYALGEKDGLAQATQLVEASPVTTDFSRREAVLDVEGGDDTTILTSAGNKFLSDEGAELEMVRYEHSSAVVHVPLTAFFPGDLITFYDDKLGIGPLQPKVEMIACTVGDDGIERYKVQLGGVKRPALAEDAAFRAAGKRKTLYVKQ